MSKVRSLTRAGAALFVLISAALLLVYSQGQLQVGYAVLSVGGGSIAPVGTALFSFINRDGVLVWETAVGAVEPIRTGRIFVERSARTRTAIALVNASGQPAAAALILRDAAGNELGRTIEFFDPRQHRARFLEELPIAVPPTFTSGSLTFESDQDLAAITLRENQNTHQEAIYTTLPLVDLNAPLSTQPIVFPQVAAGGGYSTQLILINRSNQRVTGRIRLVGSDGAPLQLAGGSELLYDIAANGTYRIELSGSATVQAGYAVVTLEQGATTPSGTAIFQIRRDNQVVTEAGVAAIAPTTSARIFVDRASTETGVAIASPGNPATTVTFELLDRNGASIGIKTEPLSAGGHMAKFAFELFPGLPEGFTGLMEITCPLPIVPITLKLTNNQRGDTILTTLPVADLTRPSTASSLIFPHIAFGSGYSTRQILINTSKTQLAGGTLGFFQSNGSSLTLPLGGQTASQFAYQVGAGAGRQYRPGNAATPAQITIDPFNSVATEVAVNEGSTLQLSPTVIDSQGTVRDDFPVNYHSISTDVAVVDANGKVQGNKAGFSTLTVSATGAVATTTITVAKVTSGVGGAFQITGLAQDTARRVYMANSVDHTILLAQDISKTPERYAGIARSEGLRNDARLDSLFKRPAFLAYDQAEGSLYVSDGANHVIRQVRPGPAGRVETLAGTSQVGSQDGPVNQASFNNPQGLVLDNRGNLWVVDSGNHTVRKINLISRAVQTMAGKAGLTGLADGVGDQARFHSPIGIAIEPESLVQQLERERKGEPPPPVSLIVADAGNGTLRRVREDGQVQTINSITSGATGLSRALRSVVPSGYPSSAIARFSSPEGVAIDGFGNIYVTEPGTDQVKAILQNGQIVQAAQVNTFSTPKGISLTQSGKLVVAETNRSGREIAYGPPAISRVTPDQISNRGGTRVTIQGKNFAPDTLVVVSGTVISSIQLTDTETLSFDAPVLPSGLTTLTLQNRGGVAQRALFVDAVRPSDLSPGQITTIAGGSTFAGDGSLATLATVVPESVAVDAAGNLFIADTSNHRIRRVDAQTRIITTVAGTTQSGFSGDNGPATGAQLSYPRGLAIDASGNLFIADTVNNRIRRVDAQTRIIATMAGTGEFSFSGDNGLATAAQLNSPEGVAVDASGNLFIAETYNHQIRRVDAQTRTITTLAGTGEDGFSGDNGLATAAQLNYPGGIAVDAAGNLFIADTFNRRIRRVDAQTRIITTVAGTGEFGFSGDNGPATAALLNYPAGIAFDAAGNLFIADTFNHRIRRVDARARIITTAAGTGEDGFSGDNGPATATQLNYPEGIAVDAGGNLFIADTDSNRLRRVDAQTGIITTAAGTGEFGFSGDDGPATAAQLNSPEGIAVDAGGNLFIADSSNDQIRRLDAQTRIITTVAGNGQSDFSGDNGPATAAQLNSPEGIAVDAGGNLFIADTDNDRIRRVDAQTRIITTVAGSGEGGFPGDTGFSGDNGPAAGAQLNSPEGIAIDTAGNLFIADTYNHRIRRVDAQTRIITTVAGSEFGFSGDNGPATDAQLSYPAGIAVDASGNLFIADTFNERIRRVDAQTRIIATVAGNGELFGFSGDNGPATAAQLGRPEGIAVDASGNLFIADTSNHQIRRVDAQTRIITTVAGAGEDGFSGDNGPATGAQLNYPAGIAFDAAGNLFIADAESQRIRAVRGPIK